jgi:hypothetical protein
MRGFLSVVLLIVCVLSLGVACSSSFAAVVDVAVNVPDYQHALPIVVVEKQSALRTVVKAIAAPFRRNVTVGYLVDLSGRSTQIYVPVKPGDSERDRDRDNNQRPIWLAPQISVTCPGGRCPGGVCPLPLSEPESVGRRILTGVAWTALPSLAVVLLAMLLRRRRQDTSTSPPAGDSLYGS